MNLDQPWCCLFSYGFLRLVYSILGKGELDAASYLIKVKSNTAGGVPSFSQSDAKTIMGRDGPTRPANTAQQYYVL